MNNIVEFQATLKRVITDQGWSGIYLFNITDEETKSNKDLNRNDNNEFVALGIVKPISVKSKYRLKGRYQYSSKYKNHQLKLSECELIGGLNRIGMINLLKEAPNVGGRIASRIVNQLGDDCLNIIINNPEVLHSTVGLSIEHSSKVQQWAIKEERNSKFKKFLYSLNLTNFQIKKCIELFSGYTKKQMQAEWHKLVSIDGISFLTAAKVADKLGVPAINSHRIREGVKHCISTLMSNGDVAVSWEKLRPAALKLLQVGENHITKEIKELIKEEQLIKEDREAPAKVTEILQCKPIDQERQVEAELTIEDRETVIKKEVEGNENYIRAKSYSVMVARGKCESCNRVCDLRFTYNPYGNDMLLCDDCGVLREQQLQEDSEVV